MAEEVKQEKLTSEVNTLSKRDWIQSIIMVGIGGFLGSIVDVLSIAIESGSISDFDWKKILWGALIAGGSQILRKFRQDENGKFNIL